MTLRPLHDQLIVKRSPLEKQTASGLYQVQQGMSLFADVVAAGPKATTPVGARIVLGGWIGKAIPFLEGEMLRIKDYDAEAIVE